MMDEHGTVCSKTLTPTYTDLRVTVADNAGDKRANGAREILNNRPTNTSDPDIKCTY